MIIGREKPCFKGLGRLYSKYLNYYSPLTIDFIFKPEPPALDAHLYRSIPFGTADQISKATGNQAE